MLPPLLEPFSTEEQFLLSVAARAPLFPDFSPSYVAYLAQFPSLHSGPSTAL